eukprot:1161306-Pelagomonas_calceolata.AAC.5
MLSLCKVDKGPNNPSTPPLTRQDALRCRSDILRGPVGVLDSLRRIHAGAAERPSSRRKLAQAHVSALCPGLAQRCIAGGGSKLPQEG